MAYLSRATLERMGFKFLGENVLVSEKASIYDPDQIAIGNNSRIDDFCVISGRVEIGQFNHMTPMCLVAGGGPGIYFEDFCTLSYGVKVFAQSDDYSGRTLVNSLIPREFKAEIFKPINIGKHVVIGAGSIVFPGVNLAEGCSVGAMTLVNKSTKPWGVYVGNPARRVKDRKQDLLELEKTFLSILKNDSL